MSPSFLTTAVFSADAADGIRANRTVSINDLSEHPFDWLAWLIILTAFAIVVISLWHLLLAHQRRTHALT